ncbi:hypothetical protein [Streptomyces sp. E-08]|uniref:hypothetical protein n=1 Tax=Streptomyces sp. E-08 TaxID=3404047 RepID=UPI003CF845C9
MPLLLGRLAVMNGAGKEDTAALLAPTETPSGDKSHTDDVESRRNTTDGRRPGHGRRQGRGARGRRPGRARGHRVTRTRHLPHRQGHADYCPGITDLDSPRAHHGPDHFLPRPAQG